MDKGFIDFYRLYALFHQICAFFVMRAMDKLRYEVISSAEVDSETGLISDQVVRPTGDKSLKAYPEEFRLVIYEDSATDTICTFMTFDYGLPALSIAKLTGRDGKSKSSSNGSNSICISRHFTGQIKIRFIVKSG